METMTLDLKTWGATILLSRTFDMREVLKMEYPNMSSKDINQVVKYYDTSATEATWEKRSERKLQGSAAQL